MQNTITYIDSDSVEHTYVEFNVLLSTPNSDLNPIVVVHTEYEKTEENLDAIRVTSECSHNLISAAAPDEILYAIFDSSMICDNFIQIFKTPAEASAYLDEYSAQWDEDMRAQLAPSIKRMQNEIHSNPTLQCRMNSDEIDGEDLEWISLESVTIYYSPVRRA